MSPAPTIIREGKVFNQTGDFAAWIAAQMRLHVRGFSVGRMQAHSPTGFMFGSYDIQKWRNLNKTQRMALHGTIVTGDARNGPVLIRLGPMASGEAVAAFRRAEPDTEEPTS